MTACLVTIMLQIYEDSNFEILAKIYTEIFSRYVYMYKRYTLFAFHIWLLKKTSIISQLFLKTTLPVPGKELAGFLRRAMKSLWKKNQPNNGTWDLALLAVVFWTRKVSEIFLWTTPNYTVADTTVVWRRMKLVNWLIQNIYFFNWWTIFQ